jgi:hypothetical protein
MKTKQKMFLGFAVVFVMAIITLAGCNPDEDTVLIPEFPSEFRGEWEQTYSNDVTATIKINASNIENRGHLWELKEVSGDKYKINYKEGIVDSWETLRLWIENDNLNISGGSDGYLWLYPINGKWRKQ